MHLTTNVPYRIPTLISNNHNRKFFSVRHLHFCRGWCIKRKHFFSALQGKRYVHTHQFKYRVFFLNSLHSSNKLNCCQLSSGSKNLLQMFNRNQWEEKFVIELEILLKHLANKMFSYRFQEWAHLILTGWCQWVPMLTNAPWLVVFCCCLLSLYAL